MRNDAGNDTHGAGNRAFLIEAVDAESVGLALPFLQPCDGKREVQFTCFLKVRSLPCVEHAEEEFFGVGTGEDRHVKSTEKTIDADDGRGACAKEEIAGVVVDGIAEEFFDAKALVRVGGIGPQGIDARLHALEHEVELFAVAGGISCGVNGNESFAEEFQDVMIERGHVAADAAFDDLFQSDQFAAGDETLRQWRVGEDFEGRDAPIAVLPR